MVARPSKTSSECIGVRSSTIPGPDERPAKSCPPLRTATSIPERRAKAIASTTSAGVRHSTTACGRTSWKRGICGLRTSSYRGEPGRTTSPSRAAVRSRHAVSIVAMSRVSSLSSRECDRPNDLSSYRTEGYAVRSAARRPDDRVCVYLAAELPHGRRRERLSARTFEGRPEGRPSPVVPRTVGSVAGVAEDEDAVVAVRAREQAPAFQVAGGRATRHERLDAPEVVALVVDVVTDLLDAGLTESEHPHAARVVRAVGEVLARIHGHLVDREVPEPERERRVERLGDRVGVDPLDLAVLATEQAHVAPSVEDRRGPHALDADVPERGRILRVVRLRERWRGPEQLVERGMGRADRDHRLGRVEGARAAERHAARVIAPQVTVHEHNRVPTGVESPRGLLAREARVIGQIAVAVVVGRRVARRAALPRPSPAGRSTWPVPSAFSTKNLSERYGLKSSSAPRKCVLSCENSAWWALPSGGEIPGTSGSSSLSPTPKSVSPT